MLRLLVFALLGFAFLSCQTESSPEETVTTEVVQVSSPSQDFEANPQLVPEQEVATLEIGADAPDFRLMGVDGRYHQLEDYADAEVLAIVFTTNHCPTAQAYEDRLIQFTKDYADKGVRVIAISPNSPLGVRYDELGYSDLNDDYTDMKIRARDASFNFDYLYDGDDHATSLEYGPVATPHTFVFDVERKLRYVGRIDKVERPGTTNAEDLRAAVDALLAGEEVKDPTTKTFGCSTKWAWKAKYKEESYAQWDARPVDLQKIDLNGVKELVANADSDKLRLINVWATWCAPCVKEYPDFVVLQRMYGGRDFEFVSLSADKPDRGEQALKFLKKVHSPLTNYHFSGADVYELIEAIDPEWNGALPYTLLVEPGGKVVWSHQAEVDFLELRRVIVGHPMIGRYF